jgi:hypothetical protein
MILLDNQVSNEKSTVAIALRDTIGHRALVEKNSEIFKILEYKGILGFKTQRI